LQDQQTEKMKIIVTGSLGHVGQPLTQALVAQGHAVTVISSKPDKQQVIEAIGARAAIGSLGDLQFLQSTFDGGDALFAMIPPNFGTSNQLSYYEQLGNNYAKAIQKAGIKHVVHLSSYGAELEKGTGFILGSHKVENILNEVPNIAVTHLRAMYIYYNLYHFTGMIKHAGFIGSNYGGTDRLVMVAPKDIAAAAAEELGKTAEGKKVRYVASDDRTCNEVAQLIGNAIGKPDLEWMTFTNEQTLDGLKQAGLPPHAAEMLVELNAAIHTGVMFPEYDKNRPAEMGKVKLEEFAKEFAAAFHQH
jgi:uncharacterized protein YbjT (DUF2867 family)